MVRKGPDRKLKVRSVKCSVKASYLCWNEFLLNLKQPQVAENQHGLVNVNLWGSFWSPTLILNENILFYV